jgi:hypothetical protein
MVRQTEPLTVHSWVKPLVRVWVQPLARVWVLPWAWL